MKKKLLNPENTVIVTDDAADLTQAECDALKVQCVHLSTTVMRADGTVTGWHDNEHLEEIYRELTSGEVEQISTGHVINDFIETFLRIFRSGRDVIYAGVHRDLSGCWDVAHTAEYIIRDEHPEFKHRRIIYADTRSISGGLGFFIAELARWYNAAERTEQELEVKIADLSHHVNHTFTVLTYDFLLKSGRFTKLEDFAIRRFCGPLKIHPIMLSGYSGQLQSRYSQVKGDLKLVNYFAQTIVDKIRDRRLWIAYGSETAHEFADQIARKVQETADVDVEFRRIGGIIACHTGPDVLSVFFLQRTPRPEFG